MRVAYNLLIVLQLEDNETMPSYEEKWLSI